MREVDLNFGVTEFSVVKMRGRCVCVVAVVVVVVVCCMISHATSLEDDQHLQRSLTNKPPTNATSIFNMTEERNPFSMLYNRSRDHVHHHHDHMKHNHVHGQHRHMSNVNEYFLGAMQRAGSNDRQQDPFANGSIMFPSLELDNLTNNSTMKPNKCDFGICEEVDNYPEERIKRIIIRSQVLKQYFQQPFIPFSFDNRFADEGESLCRTRVHTVFPRMAKNTKMEDKMLVNLNEYKQGVIFETCVKDGEESRLGGYFREGFVTTCTQKYAVRRLMAVSNDMEQPVFDDFEMPSCCVCLISKM